MFSKYSGKILKFAVVTLAFVTLLSTLTSAQTTINTAEIVPFDQQLTACNGEGIGLTGDSLITTHTNIDGQGRIHTKVTIVYRNVRGFGLTTGIPYRVTGGERLQFNIDADGFPLNITATQTLNLISQGRAPNLSLKLTAHITVNANGEATSIFERATTNCN